MFENVVLCYLFIGGSVINYLFVNGRILDELFICLDSYVEGLIFICDLFFLYMLPYY